MSLQEELRAELALEVPIVAGDNGELSVLVGGEVVYSYQDEDRMPDEGEIVDRVRARLP